MIIPNNFLFLLQHQYQTGPDTFNRHLFYLHMPQAWQLLNNYNGAKTFGDPSILIAVNDQGVETYYPDPQNIPDQNTFPDPSSLKNARAVHPDMDGFLTDGQYKFSFFYDFNNRKYCTENFSNTNDPEHGLNAASVVGAMANISNLVDGVSTGMIGIAPNCQLIASKIQNVTEEEAAAELIWLAGIDVKKFTDLQQLSGFANMLTKGADILSISYDVLANPFTAGLLGDILTSYGRNGKGALAFLASGNSNSTFTSYQPALQSEKLIGVGTTTIVVNPTFDESKTTKSNFSDNTTSMRGVDFCVPDLIKDLDTVLDKNAAMPLAATFTGRGNLVGNLNNPFKLNIDNINVATNEITIDADQLPATINGVSVNYASMNVLIGDYSDSGDESNRKYVKPQFNVISSADTTSKKIQLLYSIDDPSGKKTLTIFDFGNPGIQTVLREDFTGGSVLKVLNTFNFVSGQEITLGTHNGGPFATGIVQTVNSIQREITIQNPINLSFGKNTPVSVQRKATGTFSANTLNVTETYGLQYSDKLVVGNPSQNTAKVFNIVNVDHANKRVQVSGGTFSGIVFPQPISGFRSLAVGVTSGKVITVNSAVGLVKGMSVCLELPTDTDSETRKIASINYTNNKITLDSDVTSHIGGSIVIGGFSNYVTDFSGTSYATPVAAGIAALILSVKPELSSSEVKYLMRKSAIKVDFFNNDSVGKWRQTRDIGAAQAGSISDDVYSRWYGYGRLDAAAAVQEALNYDATWRDLKIRDIIGDDGSIPGSYTAINSPDIWNRVNTPVADGNNAYPGGSNTNFAANFSTAGPDEAIALDKDSYIWIRVNNAGPSSSPTIQKNLDGWARLYVAITDQAPSEDLFSFPGNYYGQDDITQHYTSGTKIKFIGEIKITENTLNFGSHSSLADDNIGNYNIKWDKTLKPHAENTLNTYLLCHITPFDGGNAETKVFKNNNLTYKQVKFSNVLYKQGNNKSLQKIVPVDTNGNTETIAFNINLNNTSTNYANNIEIDATINYRNGNPSETVTFKYNGTAYAFVSAPTNAWLALSPPVLSGSNANNIQELTSFSGSLAVDNTVSDISFQTKQSDNSANLVLEGDYALNIVFNMPEAQDGVAEEKKTAIYTFCNFDLLPAQSTISGVKAYGPDTANPTTEYRTWAAFTGIASGSQLKAYAVTNGEFFIQEVASSNVVNLIIKPDNQPDNKLGLVKYFVYRGIKKDSFLQPNGEPLANAPGLSDVMARMWTVRTSLDTESGTPDVLHRSDLGLDETSTPTPTPGTTLVEDHFDTYVFQKLSAGWYIGDFDTTTDYGFQVIVEGPNYKPILDDLKVLDHKITITYQTGQPQFSNNVEEDIKTKLDREAILSFVDPAAYFGLLAFAKVIVKKTSGDLTISNDAAQVNTEVLSKFSTNTNIYLDIRNELNNSLNFYGNYSDATQPTKVAVVKFNDVTNNFIDKQYHTNGWPILTLTTADFIAGAGDFISAMLQLPQGDNTYPGLYLGGASFFADGLSYKDKFKVLNTSSNYSDSFEISIANLGSPSTVLPYIAKFSYTRRYDIDNLPVVPGTLTRPWKDDYLDNILTLNETNITVPVSDPTFQNTVKWKSTDESKYVGWTSLKGADFAVKSGVAIDKLGRTYICYPGNVLEKTEQTSYQGIQSSLDLNKFSNNGIAFFETLLKRKSIRIWKNDFNATAFGNISIPFIKSAADSYSSFVNDKSFENLVSISLTDVEYNSITPLLSSLLPNSTQYFVAMNHILDADADGIGFFYFDLYVQGTIYNSVTFTYSVSRINTGIKVFSVNGRNYFSQNYTNSLISNNLTISV